MRNIKKKIVISSLLVSSMFYLTSCAHSPFMASMMQKGGGVPVNVIAVKSTPVQQAGKYQAKLISRFSVALQPQVAGQVTQIYVKAGDVVRKGQPLLLIDNRKQLAALNSDRSEANAVSSEIQQAKDTLNSLQVQRRALESAYELNTKLYERYKALYSKKSVSLQELEKYTDSYNKAKADLDMNEAQIQAQKSAVISAKSSYERAVANIEEQSVQLQYYRISAPYAGIIGDIPVKTGSYVLPVTQLLTITRNNPLEVNAGLPVEKNFDIHPGLPIEILDNNDNVAGTSTVSFISPSINTETQTILVKGALNNPKGIFKADQSVKVRVIYDRSKGILIPTGAVSHMGGQDFVFVVQQKGEMNFVKQTPVKLGELQEDKYVVIGGLKEGDKIVSAGIQKLMDGVPVMILGKGK